MNLYATIKLGMVSALVPLMLAGCASHGVEGDTVSKPAAPAATAATATHLAKPQTLPQPTDLELQAGIQIAHIATTASGGLVDARFKVLDGPKATALLSNAANVPVLIAGDKPPLMAPHHAMKSTRFEKDQVIFILYPNSRGAVQPGTEIMVAMGSTRLGPVKAQ